MFTGSVVWDGVTAIDSRVTDTLTVALPLSAPTWAVIVADPCSRAFTRPVELTAATFVLLDVHVAALVRFCMVPSVYVPVTVSCSVAPSKTVVSVGVTAIDLSVTPRSDGDAAKGSSPGRSPVGAAQPTSRIARRASWSAIRTQAINRVSRAWLVAANMSVSPRHVSVARSA